MTAGWTATPNYVSTIGMRRPMKVTKNNAVNAVGSGSTSLSFFAHLYATVSLIGPKLLPPSRSIRRVNCSGVGRSVPSPCFEFGNKSHDRAGKVGNEAAGP